MCENGLWINAIDCLQRTIKTPKLACGGSRNVRVHLNSIEVVNVEIIKGRSVFLLDDVRTTGNTLMACRILLERAGARSVKTYALGEAQLSPQFQK